MENKLDRELIARNIINILDVKNCTNYMIFMNENLYEILLDYTIKVFGVNDEAIEEIKSFLINCKSIIIEIENNSPISIEDKNKLMTGLICIKRKYILKTTP